MAPHQCFPTIGTKPPLPDTPDQTNAGLDPAIPDSPATLFPRSRRQTL